VSAPLASQWLAPLLPRFLALYPEVEFELETSNKDIDLVRDRFDLAIRVQTTPLDDSDVIIRRLGSSYSALVASPDLAARLGDISHPSHLAEAPRIGLMEPSGGVVWHLKGPDKTKLTMRFVPRLATSELDTLRAAAVGGAGVTLLPLHYCRRELETGLLRRIIPEWGGPINDIHAAYLSRRGLSICARSFVEFLIGEVPPGDGLADAESSRADRAVNSSA
jgi:DNA-binding transcriptional LysR family regulator